MRFSRTFLQLYIYASLVCFFTSAILFGRQENGSKNSPSLEDLLGQLHIPDGDIEICLKRPPGQRNKIWFFKEGEKREIVYLLSNNPDSKSNAENEWVPSVEHVYDKQHLIRVYGPEGAEQQRSSMSIDFEPSQMYAHGLWADGLLPFWGLTSAQSEKEWNLAALIKAGGPKITKSERGILLSADTLIGAVKIEWAAPDWTLERIEVVATRPDDFVFGYKLSHYKMARTKSEYLDFRYEPGKNVLLRGLKSFRFRQEHIYSNGNKQPFDFAVEIEECKTLEDPIVPNLQGKNDFAIPVSDGQRIAVLNNANINCSFQSGRVVKLIPTKLERMIRDEISNFRDKGATTSIWNVSEDDSGLCGISSLFAAACFVGAESSFADFYEPKYCSKGYGSTASELVLAAEEHKLFPYPLTGVDSSELNKLEMPALLHVRPRGYSESFSHWILFLQKNAEGIVVFDPAYGVEELDETEFSARFSGTAIGISLTSREALQLKLSSNRILSAFVVASFLVLGVWLTNKISIKSPVQAASLVVLGCVGMSLIFHSIQKDGLIRGKQAVIQRLAAASAIKFSEMSMKELEANLDSPEDGAVLIDCRYPSSFLYGTIGNAVNYPLNIRPTAERELIEGLKPSKKVILFCQSASCPYSNMIARRLHFSGVRNLYVLNGGVNEWSERK